MTAAARVLPVRAVSPPPRTVYAPPIGRRGASCLEQGGAAVCRRDLARPDEELLVMLARLGEAPPPPTQLLRRTYPGRPGGGAAPAQGVAGDLRAALLELPDRRSKVRR